MPRIYTLDDVPDKYQKKVVIKGSLDCNVLDLADDVVFKGVVSFDFRSPSGSEIIVGSGVELHNVSIATNKKGKIRISSGCKWKGSLIAHGEKSEIIIGERSTSIMSMVVAREGSVFIGADCMISRDVEIRSSDAHKIYDKSSGKRLNTGADVRIGNHVWLAAKSMVSKGAVIADDSIVAAMSFVNKKFDQPNVILAGCPALIVKEGVVWER